MAWSPWRSATSCGCSRAVWVRLAARFIGTPSESWIRRRDDEAVMASRIRLMSPGAPAAPGCLPEGGGDHDADRRELGARRAGEIGGGGDSVGRERRPDVEDGHQLGPLTGDPDEDLLVQGFIKG